MSHSPWANNPALTSGLSGVLAADKGGTGVANALGSKITLGGALTLAGAFTSTFTITGNTSLTFPTSGTLATTAGNVATATALQTARSINGTSFNGTADITLTAAAGTLTGATLAAGVTASSLTSFGNSPTLVTPNIGAATGTSVVLSGTMSSVGTHAKIGTSGANFYADATNVALLPNTNGGTYFLDYTGGTVWANFDNTGQLKFGVVGKGISFKEGANAKMGTATLVAGAVTINTTAVTANSRIHWNVNGGTITNLGAQYEDTAARVAGTSFTIKSLNILDASTIAWLIWEPTP